MSVAKPSVPSRPPMLSSALTFLRELVASIAALLRAVILLFTGTPPVLLPSVVAEAESQADAALRDQLGAVCATLELDPHRQEALTQHWLTQIDWVARRATRERQAAELIRWWQIILGVLIPVCIQIDQPGLRTLASAAGVFVAVLTAVYQFRRPDERWRHYRLLAERYQIAFWDYVTLGGEDYAGQTHDAAFGAFNARMNALRREDLDRFFGEVNPPAATETASSTPAQISTPHSA